MIIALTTLMLVAFLALLPIRARVVVYVDITSKSVFVYVRTCFVWIFKEKFCLQGRYLHCTGTVDTNLDLFSVDGKSGVNFLKAIVFDSVDVTAAVDFSRCSPWVIVGVEAFAAVATGVSCACSHCNVHGRTVFSPQNAILAEIHLSVSIAEIIFAIIKNALRKRAKRKEK